MFLNAEKIEFEKTASNPTNKPIMDKFLPTTQRLLSIAYIRTLYSNFIINYGDDCFIESF